MLDKNVYMQPEIEIHLLTEDVVRTSGETWNQDANPIGGGGTVDSDSWNNMFE